jgi:hypothetical protein
MAIKTLKLQYPVEKAGGVFVNELVFDRRPKAKDVKDFTSMNGSMKETLELLGTLTNQPPAVIDDLDVVDLKAASEIVEGFFLPGPATGNNESEQ